MEGVIAPAMNAPMMACAAMYGACGTLMHTPLTPKMTPAAIGPRKNAAGSPEMQERRASARHGGQTRPLGGFGDTGELARG